MRFIVLLFSLIGSVFLFAACGPGASTSTSAQPLVPKPTEVQVTMTEFKIEPSMTTFKVGVPYRFVVSNKGTVAHDFSITPPEMQHGGMTMSSEDMHKDALAVIEAADMPPGATKTVDVTFTKPISAGEFEFACHTPGHYEAGMQVPMTVTP
ncbi:hypothetical protein FBQ82_00280 [Anaerolineae bacterium CFX7]|nr:hypothetical protein [Anaerolineae bacterium CFX7]